MTYQPSITHWSISWCNKLAVSRIVNKNLSIKNQCQILLMSLRYHVSLTSFFEAQHLQCSRGSSRWGKGRNRWCGQDANMIGSTKVGTMKTRNSVPVSFEVTIQLKGGPQLWVRDDPLKRNFDDHPSQKRIETYETSWVWTAQAATLKVLAL